MKPTLEQYKSMPRDERIEYLQTREAEELRRQDFHNTDCFDCEDYYE